MGFSLNKAQLIGQLGQDATTSFTTTNLSVTKFSIATTHSRKTKDGNWENETTWHNVTAFGLNDFLKDQLKKGRKFYIEGRIDHQTYEKDGQTKYFTSIICDFNGIIPLDKPSEARQDMPKPDDAPDVSGAENLDTSSDLPF